MLWYELATVDEVRQNLVDLLYTYGFTDISWKEASTLYPAEDPVSIIQLPRQAYEIAEALWGEHSEELFD